MEFLLKGFAKEFEAKHGAPCKKKVKQSQGQKDSNGHTPAAGNAAKTQPKPKGKTINKKNAVNYEESGAAGGCPHTLKNAGITAAANKENLLVEFENPELNKKQKKKLRQKLRKLELKMFKESGGDAARCDQVMPTTSAKAQKSQAKLNDAEILKDTPGNSNKVSKVNSNKKTTKESQKPQIIKKDIKINVPICSQAVINSKEKSLNAKKKSCEMSSNTKKDSSISPKNKDTKQNSAKNMKNPAEVPSINTDQAVKQQEQKKEKTTDLLKPLQSKPPRHCELLKPLIFAVPEGELFSWAKQMQNLVLSLVVNTKQTTPFYVIGRHFDMRSTVTADQKVLDFFKQFLEERNAGYFTYTPKEEIRSLLVLKKPSKCKNCHPNKIKKALLKSNISVLRVEKFKAMWKPDKSYNRYLVEVDRKTDLQELFQLKTLLNHSDWEWKKLKNPSITQCRNCQRYGHVASNCRMPYRCVKCQNPHEAGKCTRTQKDGNKNDVYCHNCNSTGHPSNYRGCPAYKKRLEALSRQRESARFSSVFKKAVMSVNKALQECNQK